MSKLIKDGVIANDDWTLLNDAELVAGVIPAGNIILPLSIWQTHKDEMLNRKNEVGVWLASDELAEMIGSEADKLPIIALNFPTFMDGRSFSTARQLRERYNFTGELRAIGHIIRDQLFYLKRCGFNSYSFDDEIDVEEALKSLNDFTETYQAAVDQPQPLFRRRV